MSRLRNAVKDALGSPILDAGQWLITGMRMTTGWEDPERGDPFGRGATGFVRAGETAGSAYPGRDWQGSGAHAYETANRHQISQIESMAKLDHTARAIVAREAYQIALHRENLDDQSNYLYDLSYITWPIGLAPGAGKAMKAAIELSAVSAALTICTAELYQLSREVNDNAARLNELAEQYSSLTQKAAPPDLDDVSPNPLSEQEPLDQIEPTRPGQPPSYPVAGPASVPPQPGAVGAPPASASTSIPPGRPASESGFRTAAGPSDSGAAPEFPTDAMSGMGSAFGAMGGMIGSVVAPLAAMLTGAAGAAGQSLSALTSTDFASAAEETAESPVELDSRSEDESTATGSAAGDGEADGPIPTDVVAESQESRPASADSLEDEHPPAPPAVTRPPQ